MFSTITGFAPGILMNVSYISFEIVPLKHVKFYRSLLITPVFGQDFGTVGRVMVFG